MRGARLQWAVLCVLAACGPGSTPEEPPPTRQATFETFAITLEDVVEGQEYRPMDRLRFRVVYKGDLARNVKVTATLTPLDGREPVTDPAGLLSSTDSTSFNVAGVWRAEHEIFKTPGRFEVTLTASIQATLRGSTPWTTTTSKVLFVSNPRLDSVVLEPLTVGAPTPYGTPMTVTISGADLWDDVALTVDNLDLGEPVPWLGLTVPSDAPSPKLTAAWTLSAPSLERIAVHRLQVVATFGAMEVRSEPFSLEVTHLVDSVRLAVRDANDDFIGGMEATRMDRAKDFVLRISGTNLAGREVRLNDEPPFTAPSDSFELVRAPSLEDFEEGKGTHRYEYFARSGGTTRSANITMRRWAIEGCGWWRDGNPIPEGSIVPLGTMVEMKASGWGFPDTSGILIFKRDQARFILWEQDDGQKTSPAPDPMVNNDDEVRTVNADVLDSATSLDWETVFDEEVDFLHLNRAEYYFEVEMQDQRCRSGLIIVPPS